MRVESGDADTDRACMLRSRLDPVPSGEFYLTVQQGRVALHKEGQRGGATVTTADVARRLRGAKSGLARACGVEPGLRVLDAMAGFGVDGLVLASLGCRVHMVERSPVVFTLLEDLVGRWAHEHGVPSPDIELGDGAVRFEAPRWDVIYLDPMFAARTKTALPNKRLQYLSELLAEHDQTIDAQLIERARHAAVRRVVLKRRPSDSLLVTPDWQIVGKTVRFDVYRGLRAR
jgi:16S rRNA (guanine1516-N2)-methyltransferase